MQPEKSNSKIVNELTELIPERTKAISYKQLYNNLLIKLLDELAGDYNLKIKRINELNAEFTVSTVTISLVNRNLISEEIIKRLSNDSLNSLHHLLCILCDNEVALETIQEIFFIGEFYLTKDDNF